MQNVKNLTAEALQGSFWECPYCHNENFVFFNPESKIAVNYDSCKCSKCKKIVKIFEHYGDPAPKDKINEFAIFYVCDNCGVNNIIVPKNIKNKLETVVFNGVEQQTLVEFMTEEISTGICKNCHIPSKLEYPNAYTTCNDPLMTKEYVVDVLKRTFNFDWASDITGTNGTELFICHKLFKLVCLMNDGNVHYGVEALYQQPDLYQIFDNRFTKLSDALRQLCKSIADYLCRDAMLCIGGEIA